MITWLAHTLRASLGPRRTSSTPPPPDEESEAEPTASFVLVSAIFDAGASTATNTAALRQSSRQLLVEADRFRRDSLEGDRLLS